MFKYEILPYIDRLTFDKLLCVNKEINDYSKTGVTSLSVKIRLDWDINLWKQRPSVKVDIDLGVAYDKDGKFTSNPYMQNNDIMNMTNIHSLDLTSNFRITDKGIQNLNLQELYLWNNKNITNEGIKHMNLRILDLDGNDMITNEGIKHLNLYKLCLSWNTNITDEGIMHMNLYELEIGCSKTITDDGIKHMTNLCEIRIYDEVEKMGISQKLLDKLEKRGVKIEYNC